MTSIVFPQFNDPKCPVEIKDMIWTFAIIQSERRIVHIQARTHYNKNDHSRKETPQLILTSTCPIPALLHTCSRCRYLALQRWKFPFTTYSSNPSISPQIYFDPKLETLLLLFEWSLLSNLHFQIPLIQRHNILNLALSLDHHDYVQDLETSADALDYPGYYGFLAAQIHDTFPGLENLQIVVRGLEQCRNLRGGLGLLKVENWEKGRMMESSMKVDLERLYRREGWEVPKVSFVLIVGGEVEGLIRSGGGIRNEI